MAVADVLTTVKNFAASSSKTNNEFRNETAKNNRNITNAIKDISRMFQSQKSESAQTQNSIGEVLDITQAASRKTNENNDLLRQSISIQTDMLSQLKVISSGMKDLIQTSQEANSTRNPIYSAIKTAAAGIGIGATVMPGLLNNYFNSGNNGPNPFSESSYYGNQDTGGGPALTVAQMVKIAKEAGFNEQEAATMGAIAAAESSGNPRAHNTNAGTGDNSYGLWQINMLGSMGPERRAQFGIQNNEELLDPKKNAEAAYKIYKDQGFNAWSVYKSGTYMQYMGPAQAAIQEKSETDAGAGLVNYGNGNASGNVQALNPAISGSGQIYEQQSTLAGVRKQPLNEQLKSVLKAAASAAGVDVVVYSGGQPSKDSGGGPRTGSTRHDDGNAADLYLMKEGRKLSDENPEDRALMAKFVSLAVQNGATGVGAGHNYMGPSNIHVGFGTPATWGGAPWIESAASGIYSNRDLQAESSGGTAADRGGLGMLTSALGTLGFGGIDVSSLLSAYFGVPAGSFGSQSDIDESKESVDDEFPGRSRGRGGPTADEIRDQKRNNRELDNIISSNKTDSLVAQIQQASLSQQAPVQQMREPIISESGKEAEAMTDFGSAGNQSRNTRASWAPRVAVLRPDDNAASGLRWSSRITPSLA